MHNTKKSEIRLLMKERGAAFSDKEETASARVCGKLGSMREFLAARTVLAYMSMPGEVSLRPLMDAGGRRYVIPRVNGETLELREFRAEALQEGYRGIVEPSDEAPVVAPEEIDFAIIPGVAFDGRGNRLGHGKGFYDRLLPDLKCFKLGLCFSYRMVDSIPCEPWDIPVDKVMTENEDRC